MKRLLILALVIMLVVPVMAGELAKPTAEPIGKITIAPILKPVAKYEAVELFSDDIVKAIQQALGLAPKESKVVVYFGEKILAILPPQSKFSNMEITEKCLEYQFGTDYWYGCEVGRL